MRDDVVQVISTIDPAIDTAKLTQDEMMEYVRTRDLAKIKPFLRSDVRPTVFHIQEIPGVVFAAEVLSQTTEALKARAAFKLGVKMVKDLYQRDGTVVGSHIPCGQAGGGQQVGMTDKEVDTYFSPAEVEEIGTVCFNHSFLPKRIENGWQLPLTLYALLVRQTYRLADASPSDAPPNSGKDSAPTTTRTGPTETENSEPADASGKAIAATAQESG